MKLRDIFTYLECFVQKKENIIDATANPLIATENGLKDDPFYSNYTLPFFSSVFTLYCVVHQQSIAGLRNEVGNRLN